MRPGSGFYTMNNWRCYSSQDMTNWTSYGSILSYTNFAWGTSNSAWASQCVQKNGKFYWYVALSGSGGYGGFNIGVAVSDSPTGPFQDARGTPLITDGMTTGGDVWDDIDPTVFTDTNGVSWLGWGHGTFYLVQLATEHDQHRRFHSVTAISPSALLHGRAVPPSARQSLLSFLRVH